MNKERSIDRKLSTIAGIDSMYVEERRQHILALLKRKKRVDVTDLAGKLDASPETIRRDLNEMEADGFLKRTHGGAIYLGGCTSRPLLSLLSRRDVNYEQKSAIAQFAANFVENGDVIVIDNSTTAGRMVDFIPADIQLTVISYSLQFIMEAAVKPDCQWTCIDLGGVVNPNNLSVHGMLTTNALELFRPKKLFMSCAGIAPGGQMTEGSLLDSGIKRALLRSCQERFLLIDGGKWGQVGVVNEGNAVDLDCLITNSGVEQAHLAFAKGSELRILFA